MPSEAECWQKPVESGHLYSCPCQCLVIVGTIAAVGYVRYHSQHGGDSLYTGRVDPATYAKSTVFAERTSHNRSQRCVTSRVAQGLHAFGRSRG